MTMELSFRIAGPADLTTLRAMYGEAGRWLHDDRGIADQWDRDMPDAEAQGLAAGGETYLASLGAETVGALRLTDRACPPWEVETDDALYVHALVVRRPFAGLGLGRQMLAWAAERARQAGKCYLRLDCMAENPRLRQYYADAGFEPLGRRPRYDWFALFEKRLDAP